MDWLKQYWFLIITLILLLTAWITREDNFFLGLAAIFICLIFVINPELDRLEKRIKKLEGKKNV